MAEPVTDGFIGRRVRQARHVRGLSQAALAERCGVSFQQVQKYEKGHNRLSSGMLYRLALALEMPIQFFFEDGDPASYEQTTQPVPGGGSGSAGVDGVVHQESLVFLRHFHRLRRDQRERLGELIRMLAENQEEAR